jgi:hypothetical protein
MPRLIPVLFVLLSACGAGSPKHGGSSVTMKLPPPKAAIAPGFSSSVADLGG